MRYPRSVLRHAAAVVLIAAPLATGACSDDESSTAAAGDSEQDYCEILSEIDGLAGEAFGALEEDASEADFDAVQAQFVEDNRARFEDLVDAAPTAIAEDLRIVVDGVLAGPEAEEDVEASERVTEFDAEVCGSENTPDP